MKKIILSIPSISVVAGFKTVIKKIVSPEKDSKIVLESVPHLQIALGDKSANELELQKYMTVTVEPVAGSTSDEISFTFGEVERKPAAKPARESGCAFGQRPSNALV